MSTDVLNWEEIEAAAEEKGPIPVAIRQAGGFVHLHVHSEYSLLDGATRLKPMCEYAKSLGMNAIALTDHGMMYGCAEFYRAAREVGIKPLLGCEIYFTPDSSLATDRKPELYHMVLLAKTNQGYRNLMHMVSVAAVDNFYYKPRVTLELLQKYHEGILATSACISGILARLIDQGRYSEARDWALKFIDVFGKEDFYIELQNHGPEVTLKYSGAPEESAYLTLEKLAKELGLKTIGTNDFHYLKRDDAYTQDLMLCIGTNAKVKDENRMRYSNDQFYLKSQEEMAEALKAYSPECMKNTLEIADKCNVTLDFGHIILPHFPLPEGETNESMLRKESLAGLKRRYGEPLSQEVLQRFEHEYKIICDKGFPAYFLIVQEFTRWAKEQGIGVGPGRGSAAGSIISYALDITTFDPLENDLIFERFLSPERTEMPDIDMDFDDERRFEVIQHVRDLYGAEKIANVITYSKMKAKQAINDAARVLDYPVNVGQNISKLIASDPHATIASSLADNPDLRKKYESDADVRKIIEDARRLEGITRGEGVHASAVIICRDPIWDHVPAKRDTKGGEVITQYDGVMTAEMGLLKMDFLGLRTLTVISKALENIYHNYGKKINLEKEVDFKDPKIFELMTSGHTAGVFQVESDGMTALLKRMKPDAYSDIVATLALFRPGPLGAGMVDEFVERKNDPSKISYYDERLKSILEPTYGTMVYQEQVMKISVVMCGFTVGESDKVRKAVAKKKIALMREVEQTWADGNTETMENHWLNGAERNGYSRALAQQIWDDVLKFAEYAFNKSHSAAYAILVMQTAWLKAYYLHEYMAAVLSSFTGKTEKIARYINACKFDNIAVLPPDVNVSGSDFTPTKEGIRFGLAGLRGVGEKVVEQIVEEREKNGPYENMHDYLSRVPSESGNRRVVESLIKSGAFDSTGYTRRQLWSLVDGTPLLDSMSRRQKDRAAGQLSLLDLLNESAESEEDMYREDVPKPDGVEWERAEKLKMEKEMIGIYVSDHPLTPYAELLKQSSFARISDKDDPSKIRDRGSYTFAGLISHVRVSVTRTKKNYAVVTLEDMITSIDVFFWPEMYERFRDVLVEDEVVRISGRFERNDRGVQLIANEIQSLNLNGQDKTSGPNSLTINLSSGQCSNDLVNRLSQIFTNYPGVMPVNLVISQSDGRRFRAKLPLSVNLKSEEMLQLVRNLVDSSAIELN